MEIWKSVLGYEGFYEVSNNGRVKSLTRMVRYRGRQSRTAPGRMLRPRRDKDGYSRVVLSRDGRSKPIVIHCLMLEAFVGPRPGGFYGCHDNGDNSDNRLSNLAWKTPKQNADDRDRHGNTLRGSKQWLSRLTEDDVLAIRKRYVPNLVTYAEIAKDYGVQAVTISHVIKRRSWNHVT